MTDLEILVKQTSNSAILKMQQRLHAEVVELGKKALQWKEGCHALELALETERDAANLYAKQVAHWIEKHDALKQDAKRYRYLHDLTCRVGVDSELVRRLTYNQAHLDALIEDTEMAYSIKENT